MPLEWVAGSGPVGRQAELTEIFDFLSRPYDMPCAIVIVGDTGIGKTVVWKHIVRVIRRSCRVLSCRPASAETLLAFSALDDLFGEIIGEVLPALPEARRRALEITLMSGRYPGLPDETAARSSGQPDWRVLARGLLDALRILARDTRLVLALDDAQWLDRPSAEILQFCIRRLERESVSLVMALGGGGDGFPLALDRELSPAHLARVRLGPLSPDAINEILQSRLGAAFPRHILRRLYESSGGNPHFALESARALLARGGNCLAHEPIPVPESIGDLVRPRVQDLTADSLRIGRLLSASSGQRENAIRAAYGDQESWAAVDRAIDDGLIERDGGALRFTHPLLGPVLYAGMTLAERKEVHRRLGVHARDVAERAWHAALGADGPDEQTARTLDLAARRVASGGAPETAAVLQEQAARLTPAAWAAGSRDRMIRAADYHFRAGEIARSRELIESILTDCPRGSVRASLLIRLATIDYHHSGWAVAERMFGQATQEAPDDPALCAHAEQEISVARIVAGDLPGACRRARAALRSAERAASPRLVAHSLARVTVFEFLLGNHLQGGLPRRAEVLHESAEEEPIERLALFGPALAQALVLKWSDQLDEARRWFADCYRRAADRGDAASLPFLLYHFSELESWAGKWTAAEEYARAGCRVASQSQQHAMRAGTLYSLALVQANLGQVEKARERAAEALALCKRMWNVPVMSSVLSVLGFVELSLDNYQAAHAHLGRLAERATRASLGEPAVLRFLPDEIEALVALGEVGRARSYTMHLHEQGRLRGRGWALATAARCRAHLASAEGDYEGAQTACKEALAEHARLPMPFERGRTLLVKGMIERRAKCKSAASESLTEALSTFDHMGASLWAGKARRELSRISARPPADVLTGTERQVAALVAKGQTNRQIASAMFVTPNTVQTHIRHIFQKVGVRSRTELAARLLSASASPTASPSRT